MELCSAVRIPETSEIYVATICVNMEMGPNERVILLLLVAIASLRLLFTLNSVIIYKSLGGAASRNIRLISLQSIDRDISRAKNFFAPFGRVILPNNLAAQLERPMCVSMGEQLHPPNLVGLIAIY